MKAAKIVLKKYEIEAISNMSNPDAGKFIKQIIKNAENNLPIVALTEKKFIPPTVDEVENYCLLRNNSIDAEQFVNHYQSKGWKVGKSPMKDWKSAIITWEKNRKESYSQPKSKNNTPNIIGRMDQETLNKNLSFIPLKI